MLKGHKRQDVLDKEGRCGDEHRGRRVDNDLEDSLKASIGIPVAIIIVLAAALAIHSIGGRSPLKEGERHNARDHLKHLREEHHGGGVVGLVEDGTAVPDKDGVARKLGGQHPQKADPQLPAAFGFRLVRCGGHRRGGRWGRQGRGGLGVGLH